MIRDRFAINFKFYGIVNRYDRGIISVLIGLLRFFFPQVVLYFGETIIG